MRVILERARTVAYRGLLRAVARFVAVGSANMRWIWVQRWTDDVHNNQPTLHLHGLPNTHSACSITDQDPLMPT